MNVNDLSRELHQTYKASGKWPAGGDLRGRLCTAHRLVVAAEEAWEQGKGLICWGGFSRQDCDIQEICDCSQEKCAECEPEGIAFRLADIVMHTLALMAEHRYNKRGGEK